MITTIINTATYHINQRNQHITTRLNSIIYVSTHEDSHRRLNTIIMIIALMNCVDERLMFKFLGAVLMIGLMIVMVVVLVILLMLTIVLVTYLILC